MQLTSEGAHWVRAAQRCAAYERVFSGVPMAISLRSIMLGTAAGGAAALTLAACGSDGGDGGADGGSGSGGSGEPIYAHGTEPENPLIPTNTSEVGGGRIITSVFSGLVYYTAEGKVENEVAESIETEEIGRASCRERGARHGGAG